MAESTTLEQMAEISLSVSQIGLCDLPDSLLLVVFSFLTPHSVGRLACTCSRLRDLASDEILWRELFYRKYKVSRSVPLLPSAVSWRAEYERLHDQTPMILCEELEKQEDEVWHVSFSHNGQMFATCSRDGKIMVWNASHPCTLRFSADISKSTVLSRRQHAQFCQFNETDTMLLVSGKFASGYITSGEIYVFDLQDFKQLFCEPSKPSTLFGTWFDNDHILSGTLVTPDLNISISTLWLHKVSPAKHTGFEPRATRVLSFQTSNACRYASSITVANCSTTTDNATAPNPPCAQTVLPENNDEKLTRGERKGWGLKNTCKNCSHCTKVDMEIKELSGCQCKRTLTQRSHNQSEAEEELCSETKLCTLYAENGKFDTTKEESVVTSERRTCQPAELSSNTAEVSGSCKTGSYYLKTVANATDIIRALEKCTPNQSNQNTAISNRSNQITATPNQSNQITATPNQSNQITDNPNQSNQITATPNQSSQITATPNQSSQITATPNQSSQITATPNQSSQITATPNQSSQTTATPNQSNQITATPNQSSQTTATPNQSNQITEKLLIFSMVESTWSRNIIGFKRIRLKDCCIPHETMMQSDENTASSNLNAHNNQQEDVSPPFVTDAVDHVINIKGHIAGMALSPDDKYLFVNVRKWLGNCTTEPSEDPRLLAPEADIVVIDLSTLKEVSTFTRPPPSSLPDDPRCIFIHLNASQLYVASGAQNKVGYLWDRYYNVCLSSLLHDDIINSVAIDISSQEMLVTVGDDLRIKVWRSRRQMREIERLQYQQKI